MKEFSIVLSYFLPAAYLAVIVIYFLLLTGKQKLLRGKTRLILTALIILHFAEIATRHIAINTMPFSTLHDAYSFLAFSILLVYFIIEVTIKNVSTGFFVIGFAFILELISTYFLSWKAETNLLLTDPNFIVHASMTIIGYTALAISALYAFLYILQDYNLKNKKNVNLSFQLPAVLLLEKMSIKAVIIGIVLLGLGLLHGHIQAKTIFGSYWPDDIKVYVSDLIWFAYLSVFLLSRYKRWRGKWMAYLSLVGFFSVMVFGLVILFTSDSFHRFF